MSQMVSLSLEYLANALWQVPLVYFAALPVARWARRSSPAAEHRIWVGALLLETALPALSMTPTSVLSWVGDLLRLHGEAQDGGGGARVSVSFGDGTLHGSVGLPPEWLQGIAGVYAAVLLFLSAQLVWGLWRTYSLRGAARATELTTDLGDDLAGWMARYGKRFGVSEARVMTSAMVRGPLTLGMRSPVLLLPEDFSCSPEEDVRAALAHEFAHMGRQDFAKNLLYRFVSLPVAFHPALRATLAHIAETREMVCDAMAAEAVSGSTRYAKSLLRLALRFAGGLPDPHFHAIGIFDANTLERRLTMLKAREKKFGMGQKVALGLMAATLSVGAFSSAMAFRLHVFAGEPGAAQTPRVVRISGGVMAGQVLSKVNPEYPADARAAKLSGSVVLAATIDENGTVQDLKVISGPKELTQSAIDAVGQWTYKPYLLNGEPTSVETTITVNYQLEP